MSGLTTTLRAIRAHRPCGMKLLSNGGRAGYLKLRDYLGADYGDDQPIRIATILDSNGPDDALWCLRAVEGHAREQRLFAVWCVLQIAHLLRDPRSLNALDVAERHANGRATDGELDVARIAAWLASSVPPHAADAANVAAGALVWDAAWSCAPLAARAAAWDAASAAARAAAWEAAQDAQAAELLRVCAELDAGRDPYPQALSPAGAETTTTGSAA